MRRLSVFTAARAPRQGMIDLAPMLDVVFILLIFFIATGSFVADTGIEVERPLVRTASVEQGVRIVVAVSAANGIWIEGREVGAHRLRLHLERLHAENPYGALLVEADARSSTRAVAEVLAAARAAGIADTALSVQRK